MAAPKGHKRWGGRKKGQANKLSGDVKQMILNALDNVGGEEYLQQQATANPQAFLQLIGKVLPKDVNVRTPDGLSLSISLSR